jgi:hypothetical protein
MPVGLEGLKSRLKWGRDDVLAGARLNQAAQCQPALLRQQRIHFVSADGLSTRPFRAKNLHGEKAHQNILQILHMPDGGTHSAVELIKLVGIHLSLHVLAYRSGAVIRPFAPIP